MAKIAVVGVVAEIQTERNGKPIVRYVDGEQIPSVAVRLDQPICREWVKQRYPGADYYPLTITVAVADLPAYIEVGTECSVICDMLPNVYTDKGTGELKKFVNLVGRFFAVQTKAKV